MSSRDEDDEVMFKKSLNEKLSHRGDHYCCVQVLLLYWQVKTEKDAAFREEGQHLGEFFKTLKYGVQEFPIPLMNSQLALQACIAQEVRDASDAAVRGNAKSLLIVHYGGHGASEDEQGRAVWASSATPSPNESKVQWFRIQDGLDDSSADILLLLDCCFSGSAGRAIGTASRIEVVTASAKKETTPVPGPHSFTNGLITALSKTVAKEGYAVVSDIHRQLSHSSAKLPATSVHFVLRPGYPDRSICLRPVDIDRRIVPIIRTGPSIRLLVHTSDLNVRRIEEIASWLRTDIPKNVSLEVESIIRETESLQALVAACATEDQPIGRVLNLESTQDIAASWNKLSRIIDSYVAQHQNSISGTRLDIGLIELEARDFLRVLDTHNKTLSRNVERGILQSTYVDLDENNLDSIMEIPQIEDLGIGDQLRLRQAIKYPQVSNRTGDKLEKDLVRGKTDHDATKWTETKIYGVYMDPADIPLVEERISFISNLLAAPKSSAFRSLRCSGWHHDKLRAQFVLEFDIPSEVLNQSGDFKIVSLHQIIVEKEWKRPTLGQRFGFAAAIAHAVEQWHSIGWLHQTINSHNVIFFCPDETNPNVVEYSRPFLQGLDFARPKLGPSIGRYVDQPSFNVYRHEQRQGPSRHGHTQLHDIYSLGVVLLEIGLWQSACAMAKVPVQEGKSLEVHQMALNLKAAAAIRVAHYAGREFQEAVSACLTSDFGTGLDEPTYSSLAKAFEAKVLDKLGILEIIH